MKRSLKNEYKHLFEMQSQDISHEQITNSTSSSEAYINNKYVYEISEADAFSLLTNLENKANNIVYNNYKNFSIRLKFDDTENVDQTQNVKLKFNEIINYTYFLLTQNEISLNGIDSILQESFTNKKMLVKESNTKINIDNFMKKYFNFREEGKTKVVTKLMNSKSLRDFKANLFYFLFKKLVNKKANLEQIDNKDITESIKAIVSFFAKLITSKQTNLTVDFGAFFEEVFRQQAYECLNVSSSFKLNIDHASKKIAIVLIYCCNNIFENKNNDERFSSVFTKINSGVTPTNEDYLKDYDNIRYEKSKDKTFVKQKTSKIIDNFTKILNLNATNSNGTYCDDFENDPVFKEIASRNSPFDFIIRENDIQESEKNIGLFDLKASNKGSTSSPLSKGATGNNGGTQNSALTFINSMAEKINSICKNRIGISFFGLIQMNFTLDFDHENDYEISIESLEHKISPALTSALYSIDKDHFYLSDDQNKKYSLFNTTSRNKINLNKEIIDNINSNIIIDELDFEVRKKQKTTNAIYNIIEKYKSLNKQNILGVLSDNEELKLNNLNFLFNPNNFDAIVSLRYNALNELEKEIGSVINNSQKEVIEKIKNDKLFNPLSLGKLIFDYINNSEKNDRYDYEDYEDQDLTDFKSAVSDWNDSVRGNKKKVLTKLLLTIFDEENTYENANVLRSKLNIPLLQEKSRADNLTLNGYRDHYAVIKFDLNEDDSPEDKKEKKAKAFIEVKNVIINQIRSEINKAKSLLSLKSGEPDAIASQESEFYQKQQPSFNLSKSIRGMFDHKKRFGQNLREVYFNLFDKKIIVEGGLAGHMMHPYEALDMTPRQIIDRIKEYSTSQKIIEKVDGQNLFFTVEEDGTLMFARNKEDMTHDDLVAKFTGHGAEKPFVEGGNAIKRGVEQWLQSAGPAAEMETRELFHPDGETKSFINFEIMHPDKPNQIIYDEKYIVFHSIVDYVDGRKTIHSTNKGQRLEKIIRLMDSGISSAGFTLASNRTVNLNELTSVQIEDYVERVKEVALSLGITEDVTLGEGIENIIKQEIEVLGINLDRETLKKIYDFVLYGEDRQGNKIKSKDFTSSLAKSDTAGLRSLDLTSTSKALKKVQGIISPFKDVFVDLGVDLLKGVKSAYMSDETNQKNIELLRDKLQTAIDDLTNYMNEKSENYWEPEVHRLRQHLDKVIDKDITDIVATTVEGGVYDYQGDLIKVTGGFAPLNQILGAAYRDKKGIFPTFKQKFMQQESNRRSLKGVFNLIF